MEWDSYSSSIVFKQRREADHATPLKGGLDDIKEGIDWELADGKERSWGTRRHQRDKIVALVARVKDDGWISIKNRWIVGLKHRI